MIVRFDVVRFKHRVTIDFPPDENEMDTLQVYSGTQGVVVDVRYRPNTSYSEVLVSIIGSPISVTAWFAEGHLEVVGGDDE